MTSTQASNTIARIAGPTLVVLAVTEAINIDVFARIPACVVYLNGTLLFVGGVAILQAHNRWTKDWTVILTLIGWALLLGGLYRMLAPAAPQLGKGFLTYAVLASIGATGGWLCYKVYWPVRRW